MKRLSGVVMAGLILVSSCVYAEDAGKQSAPTTSAGTDTTAASVNDAQRTKELALKFKVPEATVGKMRESKMGWGEVETALALAQAIAEKAAQGAATEGKTTTIDSALTEILALREKGTGWGKIAQEYGFKLGEIVRSDSAKADTVRSEAKGNPRVEKVDKPEKPDKPAKVEKSDRPGKGEKPEKPDNSGKRDK